MKKKSEKSRLNPFFYPYKTPHDTVPFNKIELKDYEEAVVEGIRRDNEELEEIINNPEPPTFENTIVVEHSEERDFYFGLLDRATEVFFNLQMAETSDKMDALAEKLMPMLTQHENDIMLNRRLFERVKTVYNEVARSRELTDEEWVLLKDYYEAFVMSGALLDDAGKEKLRAMTEELSLLSLQFSQNLLKATNAFRLHLKKKEDLEGLPDTAIEAAAQEATERGKEGWIFTLDAPSYGPFMTFSARSDLRKKMYMASATRCTAKQNRYSNIEICKRIINLRREVAQLLGYKTFADYALRNCMAGKVRNVRRMLNQLISAYKPTAKEELKEVAAQLDSRFKIQDSGFKIQDSGRLEPWDFSYYSHKLQLKKYNIDSEMLRPYLKLENVISGVFGLATTLYGITFRENKKIPVYHKDVKAYEVLDKDGSYLAVLYADFYPRKGKQDGAWMTQYQGQWINSKGENIRPHVSIVTNFTKPTAKKPSLLTLGEVETFLHEFGHALHGMFANTKYESLSGTNVWRDFVELPSQFMENYAVEKDFLKTFAFHYQTGEIMPDKLIRRIVKSRNFNVAYSCLRQVSFCLLDFAYYTMKEEFDGDLVAFEKEAWKKAILLPQLPETCMTVQFSHIISDGYAAGYYCYKWAEILDADAFSVFKKHGIFNRETAQKFRDEILSKGGTKHPMTLYKNFRGCEPTIDALLKRNGIKKRKI